MNKFRLRVNTILSSSGTIIRPLSGHIQGALNMNDHRKNDHIKCSVSQCQHNLVTENYCCLDCISVGTHEDNPTVPECTDCNSFVKRSGCCS